MVLKKSKFGGNTENTLPKLHGKASLGICSAVFIEFSNQTIELIDQNLFLVQGQQTFVKTPFCVKPDEQYLAVYIELLKKWRNIFYSRSAHFLRSVREVNKEQKYVSCILEAFVLIERTQFKKSVAIKFEVTLKVRNGIITGNYSYLLR